ncbi:MAG: beta-propeller domain-containing protein [Clostridia bacterium]|nr:beta-propeller domain-containing protein [Clostridia bacterium]
MAPIANIAMPASPVRAEAPEDTIASAGLGASGAPEAGRVTPDYSTTNVQVQGVDEADVVKTDGKYIYQVNNRQVVVAEVYPADKMKIVSTGE